MVALGPLLDHVPINLLQLAIGILLLLFGLRWLRKSILRAAGIIALHDEATAFASETAELFIVIAVSAGRGVLIPVSVAELAACLLIAAAGLVVHRPLARIPENVLKFAVGVMLSAFGLFWTGEGFGVAWPGSDLAILAFIGLFLATGLAAVALLKSRGAVLSS